METHESPRRRCCVIHGGSATDERADGWPGRKTGGQVAPLVRQGDQQGFRAGSPGHAPQAAQPRELASVGYVWQLLHSGSDMLKLALVFFVISLISGALGLAGVSAVTGRIAKILFFLFLLVAVALLVIAIAIGSAVF